MGVIAKSWHDQGRLKGGAVVATVMSNLGLERYLKGMGLGLIRAAVGDRYVVEKMREGGYNVGGEQSGHMVLSDYATTGDGLLAALQVLAVMQTEDKTLADMAHVFDPVPQVLENVTYLKGAKPLESSKVKDTIASVEKQLEKGNGRLLVRPSGTEPVIRVMAEGDDEAKVRQLVRDVCATIEAAGKGA